MGQTAANPANRLAPIVRAVGIEERYEGGEERGTEGKTTSDAFWSLFITCCKLKVLGAI
jgi:hypothetical protein